MSDDAQFLKKPAVRFERTLAAPVERVWEFLTETSRLPGWYGDGKIEPRVGGSVKMMGGHIRGTVTQWNPEKKLVYTWNVFNPDQYESDYPESYVTLRLEPKDKSTVLKLTHMPVLEQFEKQNALGWHTFLDMLTAAINNQPVEDRAAYMKRNATRYGVDLNNLAS